MARLVSLIASLGVAAALLGSGAGQALADGAREVRPETERVLLGAPEPAGPTARGVFVSDSGGQIEHLVAVGHLVAWTVRTPADADGRQGQEQPAVFPTSTRVVVADERGGAPLTVDYPGRWVAGLRAFRGPDGPAEPRIAVRSCTSKKASSCSAEVLTLRAEPPLLLVTTERDASSAAAYAGRIDSGRRLLVGKRAGRGQRKPCVPPLSVRTLGGGKARTLPKLPREDGYDGCHGLTSSFLFGRYVFARVARSSSEYGVAAEYLYGLDLEGGKRARWRQLARPYGTSEYADSREIGPGVTDDALYFERVLIEDAPPELSLRRVLLPQALQPGAGAASASGEPIVPSTAPACAIAATDAAVYRLANPRCAEGRGTISEITRVVNPSLVAG